LSTGLAAVLGAAVAIGLRGIALWRNWNAPLPR